MIYEPPSQNAIQKTLDAQLLSGITASMTLNNVTGIQNKPGVCVVDLIDANENFTPSKREYISFTGVSGSTLTGLTRNADGGGSDQDHAVGAIVQFPADVIQQQAIIDTLEVEHNLTDGKHTDALVTTLKATGAVVNTGTSDVTIVTPKALADSDYAKTSDITVTADSTTTFTNKTLTSPKINEDVALTATATQLNAVGTGGVVTRLRSKVVQITRDLSAATGDVSYTGAGFPPSAVFAMAASGGVTLSFGIGDSAKGVNAFKKDGDSTNYFNNTATFGACLVFFSPTSGNNQAAIIKTWDADGLTLTWTKTGSPTGTVTVNFWFLY